jgi:hypothetical protein
LGLNKARIFRKVNVLTATTIIADEMAKNVKDAKPINYQNPPNKKAKRNYKINWRNDRKYFALPNESRKFPPGVETYSSGWFEQGHSVCLSIYSERIIIQS